MSNSFAAKHLIFRSKCLVLFIFFNGLLNFHPHRSKFFGFTEKPFSLVPNPNYLYLSSNHSKAMAFLEYGLMEKIGFVMLTGEIGTGKTTLIRHLLNQVKADMDVAVLFHTNIESDALIPLVLNEFEIKYNTGIKKATALGVLYDYLIQQYAAKRRVLLIIDEAQNLSDEVLEEIRMLSNFQTDEEMLLQIMIVGQPNLRDKIQDPRLEQFAQRISASHHLSTMTLEETGAYIGYRLEKAGGSPDLFPREVIGKIFEATAGIPRIINLLCDASLVYGYADDTKEICLDILAQVIEDKGGMGIFTKQKLKKVPEACSENDASENDALERLKEKIATLEHRINQLTQTMNAQLKESESRAKFSRDELVSSLKKLLYSERKRISALEQAYSSIKEKFDFSSNLKRSQTFPDPLEDHKTTIKHW